MNEPDWDIYKMAMERKTPPARWQDSKILSALVEHTKNRDKESRRMPELMPNPSA